MWKCLNCGELIPDYRDTCAFCGAAKSIKYDNYCINPKCPEYKFPLDDDRKTCRTCGELTKIGEIIKNLT